MNNDAVVVLSGGVGGAKLALGLYRLLAPDMLSVVVNTGDDFDHYGLRICPDIDTTVYTLGNLANTSQGWGRENESWECLQALETLGGDTWFQLGDRDLAMHLQRTHALNNGKTLTQYTQGIAKKLSIHATILPMSDQWVSTEVDTAAGRLAFQDYFVRQRCAPEVKGLDYVGAANAQPTNDVLSALRQKNLRAVIIAPSNPYLSIAPILALPGFKEALIDVKAPIIAVSPVIGDAAVKGPTAKIMRELQLTPSALTIAHHYQDLLDGMVIDSKDEYLLEQMPVTSMATQSLMLTIDDKEQLARTVLKFADQLRSQKT